MVFLRGLFLVLLLGAALSFACFALTGQPRFKRYGLLVLRWTLFGAFIFFGVLIWERVG